MTSRLLLLSAGLLVLTSTTPAAVLGETLPHWPSERESQLGEITRQVRHVRHQLLVARQNGKHHKAQKLEKKLRKLTEEQSHLAGSSLY